MKQNKHKTTDYLFRSCYLQVSEIQGDILLQLFWFWIHCSCHYHGVEFPKLSGTRIQLFQLAVSYRKLTLQDIFNGSLSINKFPINISLADKKKEDKDINKQ